MRCIVLLLLLLPLASSVLTDPGPLCTGQTATLTCNVTGGTRLNWNYWFQPMILILMCLRQLNLWLQMVLSSQCQCWWLNLNWCPPSALCPVLWWVGNWCALVLQVCWWVRQSLCRWTMLVSKNFVGVCRIYRIDCHFSNPGGTYVCNSLFSCGIYTYVGRANQLLWH